MADETSLVKFVGRNIQEFADGKELAPFTLQPKVIKNRWDFNKLLTEIFDSEAQRLGLSPERYEYSNLNEMYKTNNPVLDAHYFIYDPGSGIMRGILGNLIGEELKARCGVDVGNLFEQTNLGFGEVLFRYPGVDVGGYGSFHAFLNLVNPYIMGYNLFIAYVRQEDSGSFKYGFDDHVGLMKGVPGPGLGEVTAGEVEMYPVHEVKAKQLYEVEVSGGMLIISPIASCNWNFVGLEGLSEEELGELEPYEMPVKDRGVNTFHFLNGATPHYLRGKITKAFSEIQAYLKNPKETG